MLDQPLWEHQEIGLQRLIRDKGGVLAWDTGTGKTVGALSYFKYLRGKDPKILAIVVCPINLISDAWEQDIENFTNFTHTNLRNLKVNGQADIFIVNYESYKRIPDAIKNDSLLILDESSKIKNHQSKVTRSILKDSYLYAYKVCASATPAPNNELEYWPQVHLTKPGLFPENFYKFRNQYFVLQRGESIIQGNMGRNVSSDLMKKGFKYVLHPHKRKDFEEKLSQIVMKADKRVLKIPEMTDVKRTVTLNDTELRVYKDMRYQCITEINNEDITADNALKKIMKLRQATSGFMYDENSKGQLISGQTSKIKELLTIIEENKNKQIIIFSSFRYEIIKVKEELDKIAPTVTAYGETKDVLGSLEDFKSGKAKYIVANTRSIGHGVRLTNCNLIVFMSLDYSFELWHQARGRTHRHGQKNPCTNIVLVVKSTIDEKILEVVQEKKDKQDILDDFNFDRERRNEPYNEVFKI